jgi:hypothetical protein
MTIRAKRRWFVGASIAVVLLATAAVAAMRFTQTRPQDLLARYFSGHLESVPDERVAAELQQLAELDQVGLLVIVDALGSERACVADSAVAALDHQLERWRELPRGESSQHVACLARRLSRRVEQWPTSARSAASDLALRILDWPVDGRQVNRAALIADCEHVLRVQGTDVRRHTGSAGTARAQRPPTTQLSAHDERPQVQVEVGASAEPGGNLPVKEVAFPPLPPLLTTIPEPRSAGEGTPHLVPPPRSGTRGTRSLDDQQPDSEQTSPTSPPVELEPSAASDDGPSPIRPLSGEISPGTDEDLETLSDLELFRCLDGPGAQPAETAEKVLKKRGFRDLDLQLARQLVSPDAATRRQLAENIARLPIAASRWLIWLSQDTDPAVRSAAVSLMVTAQDPRLRRRLLEMETNEPDDGIRAQLRQWRETLKK